MAVVSSRSLKRVLKHRRVRTRFLGSTLVPRLCIFKSNRSIYLQVVDDSLNRTLLFLSSMHSKIANTVEGASALASLFADRLLAKGLTKIKFDRSGYIYHGKIAAIADALRAKGIVF